VRLIVKDFDGSPIRNAEVRAFSEDWGISYPDYFGYTDENGAYNFEIPIGNWSFFIGRGWESSWLRPGEGLFIILPYIHIMEDTTLVAQPNDKITIEVYDVNGRPLDVTIRMMDSKHAPIVVTPITGRTRDGRITMHVINGLTYDMLFFAHLSDIGYVGLKRNILSGSSIIVRLTSSDLSRIIFEAYDRYLKPTRATACINYHRFDVGVDTGLAPVCFNFNGLYKIYATPDPVGIFVNLNTDNWSYHFAVNDHYLESGKDLILRYGGPFSVKVKVLQQDSQIWLHVKDAYGNTLIHCNDDKGDLSVPVRLRKDGKIIFEGDKAKIVGVNNALVAGRIGQTFEIGASPEYEITLNLGPFGEFYLTGTLLSEETILRYDKIITE
ncbi:MAG: carboxypeptidase-like regulatory domain-containing protein, partial [Nitrososphaeria archaeon]